MIAVLIKAASVVLTKLIAAAMTEKFLMRMVILFGDKFVKSTKNQIDDQAWARYKEALNSQIKKESNNG